jgi:hypothetical protein
MVVAIAHLVFKYCIATADLQYSFPLLLVTASVWPDCRSELGPVGDPHVFDALEASEVRR